MKRDTTRSGSGVALILFWHGDIHICGNITHLLSGISSLNIDIIDVDHMVNLAEVRATLPKNVAIAGNIDPVKGILLGTPGEIRTKIQADYQMVGNPFLVNAGCESPSATPYENLKTLCEPIKFLE